MVPSNDCARFDANIPLGMVHTGVEPVSNRCKRFVLADERMDPIILWAFIAFKFNY